jgi:hypothetical protein
MNKPRLLILNRVDHTYSRDGQEINSEEWIRHVKHCIINEPGCLLQDTNSTLMYQFRSFPLEKGEKPDHTANCVICKEPATLWIGHVLFGKHKVIAGWCAKHNGERGNQTYWGEYLPEYGNYKMVEGIG